MESFSNYRIDDRLQTIILSLDVAFRVPRESWWMGREGLTIAIVCFATPLFWHQIWVACLTRRVISDATYDQYDPVTVPSECEGFQFVP